MTAVAEKKMTKERNEENTNNPLSYGCEILLEKTTLQQTKDPSFPNDAYLVKYVVDGKEHLDLCRGGKRVNVFDFYYDKYGQGSLVDISWGYGRVSPRSWGYKAPEAKKKRK
jgi:hypothetical protein